MAQPKEETAKETNGNANVAKDEYAYQLSDMQWRKKLSNQEYNVLRKKATERATTGKYDKLYPEKGYFVCRGCDQPLYSHKSK